MDASPRGVRVHFALLGRRNAGKSSLLNAIAGQPAAVVSPVAGTTTDPVSKAMELLPLGPVVFTDTPGIDDDDPRLGAARAGRARAALATADAAVLVIHPETGIGAPEREVAAAAAERKIPLVPVVTHAGVWREAAERLAAAAGGMSATGKGYAVDSPAGEGIAALREALSRLPLERLEARPLLADLLPGGGAGAVVVFVTPIDSAAPKGRLILPQQQAVRDALDHAAVSVVVRETELRAALDALAGPPALVVTDSQAFKAVAETLPDGVPLTSFSILFARLKGDLAQCVEGARAVDALRDGSRVLIAEACTHHRQGDDIATIKIPRMLRQKTGKTLEISHVAGGDYPADLAEYDLVVHCGACMLTRNEMLARLAKARAAGVPITNYGVLIAKLLGILDRALEPFGGRLGRTECEAWRN
ncbi:MAG: [Kiritimatiellae bacterium]|nr:[FeFe] hydrogenase H-cluster maturation GTPase HydF [Kiritimatiellia bacterium]